MIGAETCGGPCAHACWWASKTLCWADAVSSETLASASRARCLCVASCTERHNHISRLKSSVGSALDLG